MLAYSRSKVVGVQRQSENRRVVTGVLEDELYAMECEIAVDWPSLVIQSVQARMKRFTTSRCALAEEVFVRAEGWRIDKELDGKIKKDLGRNGCRHMAILMVDCCRTLARAELAAQLRDALEKDPALDRKQFLEGFLNETPHLKDYLRLR